MGPVGLNVGIRPKADALGRVIADLRRNGRFRPKADVRDYFF
jgi:hypothetical protein